MTVAHTLPTANGLGRRQRQMLVDLATVGQGHWPTGWKLYADSAAVLASLHRKGLVSSADTSAMLTPFGYVVAARSVRWIGWDGK